MRKPRAFPLVVSVRSRAEEIEPEAPTIATGFPEVRGRPDDSFHEKQQGFQQRHIRERNMRRATLFLSVMAIAALAASSAQATFIYGVTMDASEGTPNLTNPNATTNGCIWINMGSGLELMPNDVNAQLLVYDTNLSTPAWTVLNGYPYNGGDAGTPTTSTLLLSDNDPDLGGPSATGDITSFGPGVFYDNNGLLYGIPNKTTDGGTYQFQLFAWTGTTTSYAAAEASHTHGVYAGESAVFTANAIGGTDLPGLPNDTYGELTNMPAFTLVQVPVPEPSTLMLTGCALTGLLAYAWRKRK
jgi:hypothetical protein